MLSYSVTKTCYQCSAYKSLTLLDFASFFAFFASLFSLRLNSAFFLPSLLLFLSLLMVVTFRYESLWRIHVHTPIP